MEATREFQILFVAGASVEFGEHFVHAAMFTTEHALKLFFGEVRDGCVGPVSKFDGNARGLLCSERSDVTSSSPAKSLCNVYHGTQPPLRSNGLHANVAGGDFLKDLFAVRNGGDVAVAVGALAGFELGDDVVHSFAKADIAGGGKHQRASRKVVAERVTGDGHRFPTAVGFGFWFETCFFSEAAQ